MILDMTILNYQQGHCHYLAREVVTQLRQRGFQNARYTLVLATRQNPLCIERVLVHAYASIGRYVIDSEGRQRAAAAHRRRKKFLHIEQINELYDDGNMYLAWQVKSRVVSTTTIPSIMFNEALDPATEKTIAMDAAKLIDSLMQRNVSHTLKRQVLDADCDF